MTASRQDIHRPSAENFDPEGYEFIGAFDLHPEDGTWADRVRVVSALVDQGITFADVHPTGQCDHCGAYIRYEGMLVHLATRTIITVGEQCLDNRFTASAAEFKELRDAAAAKAKATREANARHETSKMVLAWLSTQDERLAELSYRGNGGDVDANYFLADVASKLFRYGNLSDRQIEAVLNAIVRDADRRGQVEAREAETAARQATAAPAPSGKVAVEGTVGATWSYEGDYGTQFKFRVVTDAGWVAISSIPKAIIDALQVELGDQINVWAATDRLRSRRVQFTATLTPTDDDKTAAWAKRPSKAQLVPAA